MGTRAAFFVGDARDVENRTWLGCIAWDGYPEGDCSILADAATESAFRALVGRIACYQRDAIFEALALAEQQL